MKSSSQNREDTSLPGPGVQSGLAPGQSAATDSGSSGEPARPSSPQSPSKPAIGQARLIILLGLGTGAAWLLTWMLWPLMPAIVTSGVVAVLVYPLHKRFVEWLGWPNVTAFLTTAAAFLLVLLPLGIVALLVLDRFRDGLAWMSNAFAGSLDPDAPLAGSIAGLLERVRVFLGIEDIELMQLLNAQLGSIADIVAQRTLGFLSGLGGWLIQGAAAIFTLFYLLRDARPLVSTLERLMPLEPEQAHNLMVRAREVTFATMYGNVLVAGVQGVLGGLAFAAVGLPTAAFWGAVMALLALLPVVGPPLVWLPGAIVLLTSGQVGRAIALVIVGTIVISTVDNLLRAFFVSGRAQLHPLVVFMSVLGGLFVFGAAGVFLGPVLFVLALTVLEMARSALGPDAGTVTADEPFLLKPRAGGVPWTA